MTKKKRKKSKVSQKERQSVLDHANAIVNSPVRLFVFCAALLLISLTAGMLIGTAVKDDENTASLHPERPDLILGAGLTEKTPVTAETDETDTASGTGTRPVDAFSYDNPYTVPRALDGEDEHEMKAGEKDDLIASLPPLAIPERSDTLPPWRRYAALSEPAKGRPKIAIVIDDVGLNKGRLKGLVDLPEILTLSFLPYATDLETTTKWARAKGHEVMLHLPMEPLGTTADPGPDALLQSLSLEEIRMATLKNLAQFNGYVGVNNHMGSKFTAYEAGMAVVMDILSDKGLLFLDSRTTPTSKGFKLATERGMPAAVRDVFIDNKIEKNAILKQLEEVEKIARKNGVAIAIGHPHKATIAALKEWMPKAIQRGFYFIPMSAGLSSGT